MTSAASCFHIMEAFRDPTSCLICHDPGARQRQMPPTPRVGNSGQERRIMRTITSLPCTTAILALAMPARAGIAFDDFGPGNGFDPVEGYVVAGASNGPFTVAAQFTAAASGELSTIRLALAYIAGENAF